MKKITIILIALFAFVTIYSQNKNLNDNFNCLIRKSVGDLNKDGLLDKAIISMDTVNDAKPLRLQIFFAQPNKKFKLFFSSTEIIEAMYPLEKNGKYNGSQIPDVYIEEGKLQLDFYIKGNSRYEFRFKNGEFELTYFSYVNWNSINITETEFNLLTGKYTKQTEINETSEITLKIKGKIQIRPLPQLKNFKPFENEFY
ncbi:MAG: hypothetical protein HRT73_13025 [Flavobacteriales bacterium]|nr:hypothetical protein [Flavobacteriales bacterium]